MNRSELIGLIPERNYFLFCSIMTVLVIGFLMLCVYAVWSLRKNAPESFVTSSEMIYGCAVLILLCGILGYFQVESQYVKDLTTWNNLYLTEYKASILEKTYSVKLVKEGRDFSVVLDTKNAVKEISNIKNVVYVEGDSYVTARYFEGVPSEEYFVRSDPEYLDVVVYLSDKYRK